MTRTPAARRAGTTSTAEQLALLALVALVGVVLPVWIAQHHRALGVPRGDDWSYLRTLFAWVDTGDLNFNNWVSMTLIGQLVLAAPVVWARGRDIAAVQVLVAVLGFLGLVATMRMGRYVTGRARSGAFVAVLVAAGPMYGTLAVSFMTDVPGFAASTATVLCGLYACSAPNRMRLGVRGAFVFGLLGFTIRQYAVLPTVAVVVVVWLLARAEADRAFVHRILAGLGGVIAAAALFLVGWSAIPDSKALSPTWPDLHAASRLVHQGGGMIRLLGLWVLPAVLLAGPRRLAERSWRRGGVLAPVFGVGTLVVLTATGVQAPRIAFAGNYLVPDGILSDGVSTGLRPDLVPGGWWNVLIAIGTIGAALLATLAAGAVVDVVGRLRRRDLSMDDPVATLLGLTLSLYGVAYGLAALGGLPLFDRYILPAVPLAAFAVLRAGAAADHGDVTALPTDASAMAVPARARDRALVAGPMLVAVLLLGLLYTVDSASFDGVRWRVAVEATRVGWHPRQVGGSFEWVNYFSSRPGTYARRRAKVCVIVVVNPEKRRVFRDAEVVASGTYRPPFRDSVPVRAVRNLRPCFPGVVPADPLGRPQGRL